MAVLKMLGGFSKSGNSYLHIKISNELWSFSRGDSSNEKQTQLFFIGWYTIGKSTKLFTVGIPFVSIQFAFAK